MTTHRGWTDRARLPHFDSGQTLQMVTYRLADSIPAHSVERAQLDHRNHPEFIDWLDERLNAGHGSCVLKIPKAAECVQGAFLHFHGNRYVLHAWVIMPNHVHVLFDQRDEERLADIVQAWKSFTSKKINSLLGRSGTLWSPDYFDRFIRNDQHYAAAIRYIEENPVMAGLVSKAEDWPWSSAGSDFRQRA